VKLSEIKQILAEHHIRLSKSLGQNFLHDGNQLRRIVAAADLKKSDKVLEIGPGLGPLTQLFLEQAGEAVAIEKDARLVEVLRRRLDAGQASGSSQPRQASGSEPGHAPILRLIHDDALDYLRRQACDWSEWKLVSSLPYSVASPILVELAQAERGPQRLVVTVQLEVARRLVARPGDAHYGLLTLLIQLSYTPLRLFKIPACCFFPEPEVDSACVSMARRAQPLLTLAEREVFSKVVKRGFSQRRKMMLKPLKQDWPIKALQEAFGSVGLLPQVRAEAVSLEQFVRLARRLTVNSKGADA